MAKKYYIFIGFVLMLMPVLIFVYVFHGLSISQDPDHWQIFGGYIGGTTGTVASIYAGYLVYKTVDLQATTLLKQSKQSAEQLFMKHLDNFVSDKKETAEAFKILNHGVGQAVRTQVTNEYGDPRVPNDENIASMFVTALEWRLISDYSVDSPTPRLKPEFIQYIKHINALCYFFIDLKKKGYDDEVRQLKAMLLTRMDDNELMMVVYYYYMFYEIVHSKDAKFTIDNPVKLSGLFTGTLFFSDDFSRNLDPREGVFDNAIEPYRHMVAKRRRARDKRNERLQNGTPDYINESSLPDEDEPEDQD